MSSLEMKDWPVDHFSFQTALTSSASFCVNRSQPAGLSPGATITPAVALYALIDRHPANWGPPNILSPKPSHYCLAKARRPSSVGLELRLIQTTPRGVAWPRHSSERS